MTPHLHPQTQGPLRPPTHPAPAGPTQCLRRVYSSPPERGEVTRLVFLGSFGSQLGAPTRRSQRGPPAAGVKPDRLGGPTRGRSSPANLTRWLAPSPVDRSNSGSPTAQRRPLLCHFRRGVSALTRSSSLPHHTHTHTEQAASLPTASTPSAVRGGGEGILCPGPPRSWLQSCSGR